MKTVVEDIKINDTLNPDLWENNELKEEVKEKLLDIVDNFLDILKEDKVNIDVVDVRFLGSNANYNYTDKSDIDLHIVADLSSTPCEQNVMPQLYNAYKSIFNSKYNISIYGHDVEIYVEDVNQPAKSNGVYSLYTGWIKEPNKDEIPNIDWEQFELVFDGMEDRYFDIVGEHLGSNVNEDLNKEKEIVQSLIDVYGESDKFEKGSSFILPNGKFINLGSDSHMSVDNVISWRLYGCDAGEGNWQIGDFMNKSNAIRVGDGAYIGSDLGYISFSNNITPQQWKALDDFIFYCYSHNLKGVDVELSGYGEYLFKDYENPDDIIKEIKRKHNSLNINEAYANNIDKDILDTIKNPLDKLYKNTKCSKSAGTFLDKYFYETDKPLKLCLGAIRHKGDETNSKVITHVWVEVDGKVKETNFPDGDYERVLVDELLLDRNEDLYNQVEEFLNKPSLREDLQQEVDSEGNPLTPEQVEFFKNSKVRDSKGRLLVVYHGTEKGGFNSFKQGSAQNGNYGSYGIFFSSNRDVANTYLDPARKEGEEYDGIVFDNKENRTKSVKYRNSIYSCYLSITNPFIIDCEGRNALNCQIEIDGEMYYTLDDICAYADDKGYDGVIANNIRDVALSIDNEKGTDYVTFNPNQIKSIDNKNPSDSDNINEDLDDYLDETTPLHRLYNLMSSVSDVKKLRKMYDNLLPEVQEKIMGYITKWKELTEIDDKNDLSLEFEHWAQDILDNPQNYSQGITTEINDSNIHLIVKDILSTPIVDLTNSLGYTTHNNPERVGAMFILPNGEFIFPSDYGCSTHQDFIEKLIEDYSKLKYSNAQFYAHKMKIAENVMEALLNTQGLIRCNSGSTDIDGRFYCVLQSRFDDTRPTNNQFDALLKYFDLGLELGRSVGIYCGEAYNLYSLGDYMPEDLVKLIKRFYSSGTLYEDYDYDKVYQIKELYKKAYDELIDNSTRLYRYREWASNSNNGYKEYIYNDLKNNKKDSALNLWYNHYRLMTGNYDLSYEDFLNTPITLYRATNIKEDEDSNNPFFSYAQNKRGAERFLSQVQNLYGNRSGEIKEIQIKPKDTLGMLPSDENEIIVPNNLYQKRITNIENIVDELINYANVNNVELPYDRDELLDIFKKEGRDTENFRKHMLDWIDKRKGKLKESKLKENNDYGYHAGDLGKSEGRQQQDGGRGTGHFGTGTYFVGNPDKIKGYNDYQYGKGKAPHHIVDFSSYNLYKPSNNEYGYKLHDTLKLLNNGYKYFTTHKDDLEWFKSHNINASKSGEFESKDIPEIVEHLNNLIGEYDPIELPKDINWNTIDQEEDELWDKYYDELKPQYKDKGTGEFFDAIDDKIKENPKFVEYHSFIKTIREAIEEELDDRTFYGLNDYNKLVDKLYNALEGRHSKEEIQNALNEVNKNLYSKVGDSLSTIFMKALGYEGIDVRHLQDDNNWAGLDNTTYGSVIYDLKPDTIVENIDKPILECYNSTRGDNMRLTEEQLNEMARVGQILDKYEIYVYSGEGFIPHFHLFDKTTKGDKFHSCIRIDECSYFDHEGKNDKLNNKMKKALVDFLESKPNTTKGNFLDYWDVIVFLWNLSNPGKEIDENIEMPNYYEL